MTTKNKAKFLVAFGDVHAGDTFAVLPCGKGHKDIELDFGGLYHPTEMQEWLYKCWDFVWNDWLPKIVGDQPYSLINMGDTVEGVHHCAKHMITQNIEFQKRIALSLLKPIVDKCKASGGQYWHLRGTDVHDGVEGCDAEGIARELGAEKIGNQYSHMELKLNLQGKNIHASHTISTGGIFTGQHRALAVEYAEALIESSRWTEEKVIHGKKVQLINKPSVVLRAHRHVPSELRFLTSQGYAYSLVTPAFQMRTPYATKVIGGRQAVPVIGAMVVCHPEDELYTRWECWGAKDNGYKEI